MYRFELDAARKIAVLVIHGMQDGWEAKMMRLEFEKYASQFASGWHLIVDMKDAQGIQRGAVKDYERMVPQIVGTGLKNLFLVEGTAHQGLALMKNAKPTICSSFQEAYEKAGGERRDIRVEKPAESRYPANNPPPANQ